MNLPTTKPCESCGMTIDDGAYCSHCTDDRGDLQKFEERFERMQQWMRRRNPDMTEQAALSATRAAMREMPAWRDHPELQQG